MPDLDLYQIDFTSLGTENILRVAEDFVRVLTFVTRDPPRLQAEEKRIDTISEAVSSAESSPTGLSPRDEVALAGAFREALARIHYSNSPMREVWIRTYVHALLRGSHVFPEIELSTEAPDYEPLGFFDVWRGDYHGGSVCIKAIRTRDKSTLKTIKRIFSDEVQGCNHFSHPNILPVVQVSGTLFPFCIVSPWMPEGNIMQYTQRNSGVNRLMLLAEVCDGLSYLHGLDISHGCIAPGNIIISRDGRACLGDFGIVGAFGKQSFPRMKLSTARYMAVERLDLLDSSPSKKSDIYSLALTSFAVLTGVSPYEEIRGHYTLMVRVKSGDRPIRPKHQDGVEWLQDRIWAMIMVCWGEDPNKRWGLSDMCGLFRELSLQEVQKVKSDIKTGRQQRPGSRFRPRVASLFQSLFVSQSEIQRLVDEMDERLESQPMTDEERLNLFNRLCKKCSRHRVVPKSLNIPDCLKDATRVAYTGGFANVYKSTHEGYKIAVKVINVNVTNLNTILSGFCREVVAWKHLRHPNILPLIGVTVGEGQFAMVSEWMDNGNLAEFVRKDYDANRIALLADVANGLKYMHGLRVVHGDLKGANILINKDRRACIADFSLTTVTGAANYVATGVSPTSTSISEDTLMSFVAGGTPRWMSPELLDPEKFGIQSENNRPTKQSDCFALGMVIYEILCGHHPFIEIQSNFVMIEIIEGRRPAKPHGAEQLGFNDELWTMVERCWLENRDERPNVEEILTCLNEATAFWYMRGS